MPVVLNSLKYNYSYAVHRVCSYCDIRNTVVVMLRCLKQITTIVTSARCSWKTFHGRQLKSRSASCSKVALTYDCLWMKKGDWKG